MEREDFLRIAADLAEYSFKDLESYDDLTEQEKEIFGDAQTFNKYLATAKARVTTTGEETFTFTVNHRQLRVIRAALDNYARMGMGQLEVAVEEFLRYHFWGRVKKEVVYNTDSKPGDPTWRPLTRPIHELVRQHTYEIKRLVFNHPPNGSWGIFNERVPADCREAYDIRQIVGKADVEASRREGVDRSWDVDNRSYLPTNPEEPPIKIESSRADADVPPES